MAAAHECATAARLCSDVCGARAASGPRRRLRLSSRRRRLMKAGVGIDPGLGLTREQQRTLVQQSARLEFESLWTPAGLTGRSIFQICREWWQATTEIVASGLTVGTSVIPVPGYSVPQLAAESAT